MTTVTRDQNGVTHLVLLLALVVVVAAAFVGYRVMNDQDDNNGSLQTTVTQTPAPDQIANTADLDQATKAVSQTPLDSELDPGQYDQDVDSLL